MNSPIFLFWSLLFLLIVILGIVWLINKLFKRDVVNAGLIYTVIVFIMFILNIYSGFKMGFSSEELGKLSAPFLIFIIIGIYITYKHKKKLKQNFTRDH